jgi:hypothetical protein
MHPQRLPLGGPPGRAATGPPAAGPATPAGPRASLSETA